MLPVLNNLGLDRRAIGRIKGVYDKYNKEGGISPEDIFASERAGIEISEEKVFLESFNLQTVLSHIPFADKIYIALCPVCVSGNNLNSVKTLIDTGSILPILITSYDKYTEEFATYVRARDHINKYEFSAYRSMSLSSEHQGGLCEHCAENRKKGMMRAIKARSDVGLDESDVNDVYHNLRPFVYPDFELMDEFKKSIRKGDREAANEIVKLSNTLNSIRTYQSLNAPITIKSTDLPSMSFGGLPDIDAIVSGSEIVDRDISSGMGLRIPSDIPLEAYVEIANDYRSRIRSISRRLDSTSWENIQPTLMKLNADIAKLSQSKRIAFWEGAVQFYTANSIYLNASLAAGAAGLTLGLPGCAAGGLTAGLATLAKKRNWIAGGPEANRALELGRSFLSPITDRLVAAYAGSSTLAVSVMSLRRDLERRADQLRPQATKLPKLSPAKRPKKATG